MEIRFLQSDSVTIISDGLWKAYFNTVAGRAELEAECTPEVVAQVYEVWGAEPTVTEPTYPQPEPATYAQLRAEVDMLLRERFIEKGVVSGDANGN